MVNNILCLMHCGLCYFLVMFICNGIMDSVGDVSKMGPMSFIIDLNLR